MTAKQADWENDEKTMMMIELATGWLYTAGGGGASPDQTKKGHGVGTPHQLVF